jgi:hypothetical protein
MTRDWKIGICGMSCVAIALLLYALFGRPPYVFFSALKWTVAASAVLGAWTLYTQSRRYLPVSVCLLVVGGIHLFGRMRRSEWVTFNWTAVLALTVLIVILLVNLQRDKPTATTTVVARRET